MKTKIVCFSLLSFLLCLVTLTQGKYIKTETYLKTEDLESSGRGLGLGALYLATWEYIKSVFLLVTAPFIWLLNLAVSFLTVPANIFSQNHIHLNLNYSAPITVQNILNHPTTEQPVTPKPNMTITTDPTIAKVCEVDSQIVILIDSSQSITTANYPTALKFASGLAQAWKAHSPNRVAVAIYSTTLQVLFTLTESAILSEGEINAKIFSAPYLDQSTFTHLGLEEARNLFRSSQQPGVPITRNKVIVLTDGKSTYSHLTTIAAAELRRDSVNIFTVGVGHGVDNNELLDMTGGMLGNVFTTDNFAHLLKLLQPVSTAVCKN